MIFIRNPSLTPAPHGSGNSFLRPCSFGGGSKVFFCEPSVHEAGKAKAERRTTTLADPERNTTTTENKPEESACTFNLYQNGKVHIEDENEAMSFAIDLPGFKSSDVKVRLHDSVLQVIGERKLRNGASSKYVKQFLLKTQNVDEAGLKAKLEDGVLTITVPKKKEADPIDISVSAENPPEEIDNEKDISIVYDVPGVKANDAKLKLLANGKLAFHAERKRGSQTFTIDRVFHVDESTVDEASFKAFVMDGVLTITARRKDVPEPKMIEVSGGSLPSTSSSVKSTASADEEEYSVVETVTEE